MVQRGKKITDNNTSNDVDNEEFKIIVDVKIGQKLIKKDVDDALYIPTIDKLNPIVISKIMAENPSLHARWNIIYNQAVYEYDTLKTKLEVWGAKKAKEYRKELQKIADKEKIRVTDKLVDETIKQDPEFKQINNDIADAKMRMNHIRAIANGFGEKGEKIVNIASMMKWEAENLAGSKKSGGEKKYPTIRKNDDNNEYNNNDVSVNGGWPT